MEVQYDNTKITFIDNAESDAYVVYYKNVKRVHIDRMYHCLCFDLIGEKTSFDVPIPRDMCLDKQWEKAVDAIEDSSHPSYDVVHNLKKMRKSNKDALESIYDRLGGFDAGGFIHKKRKF